MGHKFYVRDLAIVTREVELPDACPRCKIKFEVGSTDVEAWHLRPRLERLRLTTVTDGHETTEVCATTKTMPSTEEEWIRMPTIVRCGNCTRILFRLKYKVHDLQRMDKLLAFKLRGILYDETSCDETIRRRCFDETVGYHGDCIACNIEADIGTEEVPHPIDRRLHTCVEST